MYGEGYTYLPTLNKNVGNFLQNPCECLVPKCQCLIPEFSLRLPVWVFQLVWWGPIKWILISWNFPFEILHAFSSYCSRN